MSVHTLFASSPPTPPSKAALDVLRDRHTMFADLGHSRADEYCYVRDELLVAGLQLIDAATVTTLIGDRRELLVRAASLLIAELERIDRAAAAAAVAFIPFGLPS